MLSAHLSDLLKSVEPEDGGFSFNPFSGSPTFGYMASPFKNLEEIYKPGALTLNTLTRFADKHAHLLLNNPDLYIGGWHDKKSKQVYLDISRRFRTVEEAQRVGSANEQHKYYNLQTGKSEYTHWGQARADLEKLRKEAVAEKNQLLRSQRAPFRWVDGHLELSTRVPEGPKAIARDAPLDTRTSALYEQRTDGSPMVDPKQFKAYADYAQKWVKDHADTYRLQRFVNE